MKVLGRMIAPLSSCSLSSTSFRGAAAFRSPSGTIGWPNRRKRFSFSASFSVAASIIRAC
jgi:hypothetical protein